MIDVGVGHHCEGKGKGAEGKKVAGFGKMLTDERNIRGDPWRSPGVDFVVWKLHGSLG